MQAGGARALAEMEERHASEVRAAQAEAARQRQAWEAEAAADVQRREAAAAQQVAVAVAAAKVSGGRQQVPGDHDR